MPRPLLLVAIVLAGCHGRNLASSLANTPAVDQARCGVTKSQARPLIIEWPSPDRAALEGLITRDDAGMVAVRYEGCEMELLRRCSVAGNYAYTGVGAKRDDQVFRTADELYTKIPLGAAQLEGEIERHGTLSLKMTVVGHYEAGRSRVERRELRGDCESATHVISAVTVGAFRLSSGAGAEVSGGVGYAGVGAGGSSSAERGFERSDGDTRRCGSGEQASPPDGCGALLRLEVEPIREEHELSARRKQRPCPRGTVLVEGGRYRTSLGGMEEVGDFCIDLQEVSVGDYADCASDGPCSAASVTVQADELSDEQRAVEGDLCNGDRATRRRHPVNCVAWHQAETYCRAQGGRLPSEYEWEWAARGGAQERSYAWGESEPGPELVNACGRECARHFKEAMKQTDWPTLFTDKDGDVGTAKTGSHRRGAGAGRVQDLAGNVWEWTASPERGGYRDETYPGGGMGGPDAGSRVVRGGGFMSTSDADVRVSARGLRDAKDRRADVGFRCVREP